MSRLGDWQPDSLDARCDRLESLAAIQQLAFRYGQAIDARDIDMLVDLFVSDVQVGRDDRGRTALKRWYIVTMSQHGPSCHFVGNHVVNFDDADNAHGVVYCHDELEQKDTREWWQGQLQYWDQYRRDDGEWYFVRRRLHRLYISDWFSRPSHGAGLTRSMSSGRLIPDAYSSWGAFWENLGEAR